MVASSSLNTSNHFAAKIVAFDLANELFHTN